VDVHLQEIFYGQEWKGTEKLMGMHMGHMDRKIVCSILFWGQLNQTQLFLSFCKEKVLFDLNSQSDSFVVWCFHVNTTAWILGDDGQSRYSATKDTQIIGLVMIPTQLPIVLLFCIFVSGHTQITFEVS